MGNWRSVDIVGTIDPSEVQAAHEFVNLGDDWDNFHCLAYVGPSLCGLGDWPAEKVAVTGNLAERDYDVEDVADALRKMAEVVPSLVLKVHCGGDYEDKTCIATVTVQDGEVTVGEPEKTNVGEGIEFNAGVNLMSFIMGRGAR